MRNIPFFITVTLAFIAIGYNAIQTFHTSEDEYGALLKQNIEALTENENPLTCKWKRIQDTHGCWYHECRPDGNGFECVCGTISN